MAAGRRMFSEQPTKPDRAPKKSAFHGRFFARGALAAGFCQPFSNRLRFGRQFSLRSLLLLVSAAALLSATWRPFGAEGVAVALFAILSLATLLTLPRKRKLAFFLSWSAVYGPFVAMAIYTTLYVSCSHCKAAAWTLLPYAPGLVPVELAANPGQTSALYWN